MTQILAVSCQLSLQVWFCGVLVFWQMNRVYRAVALVFLVLWVPITAHCCLEKLPGLEFLQCASDTSGSPNCEGDACQTIESGAYKISESPRTAPAPAFFVLPLAPLPLIEDAAANKSPAGTLVAARPDLPKSWQFISRTALPVRAPSLLS